MSAIVKEKRDLYQEITDSIIEALEKGVPPWKCPWDKSRYGGFEGIPYNLKTKNGYSGINVPILWASQRRQGFESSGWASYKQIAELGGQVGRGSKGTTIVYWNFVEKEDDKDLTKNKRIPFMKSYTVFNLEQTEGLDIKKPERPPVTWENVDPVESVIAANKPIIQIGGDLAGYNGLLDVIRMPDKHRFKVAGDYYCTLLHEMTHWTGHPKRFDRQLGNRFGIEAYAFEELIAEMGSAFLFADLGLEGAVQHDSYIANWLRVLKDDKKAIFKAATEASKAHQFIIRGSDTLELEEAA